MGALKGLRILDFTQMKFGPFATQILGDVGADIIKVEKPGGEFERTLTYEGMLLGDTSPFFLSMNRNKRSIVLNLKDHRAHEIVKRLVSTCDVVVSNYRPGVMQRLGLDYESLKAIKPDIIVIEASGWGADGPYVARPGQDLLVQAVSGVAANSGLLSGPPIPTSLSISDTFGALYLAIAILVAYQHKQRTGEGQLVQLNLLDVMIAVQCEEATAWLNMGGDFERPAVAPGSPWASAPYGIYRVRDGYIALAMNNLSKLGKILSIEELHQFDTPDIAFKERDKIARIIQANLDNRDLSVVEELLAQDIWCAQVQSLPQALHDPQVIHNGMIQEIDHPGYGRIKVIGHPIHYSKTPASLGSGAPKTGEHTAEILKELGFDSESIKELFSQGVIC
ncbi:CaiB/BaiF CoA transferase family protein [Alicyclobacillus kakegawensis]|uniref:CaiB/BaiF CoA transferase family protein n=1 Tax=Alicyclobacillus kakegawensis TaxID=392012 RepID=UPI00082B132D|nr:CoA transferase [Alicyclobacillus kakegawensis]